MQCDKNSKSGEKMNCNEAIEYIHSLEKFGINPGLERIRALCADLGNPQDKLKIIHVAGTNGKGSTSTMISNILQKSGFQTGLFISPYVTDFRERIQLNGQMIEKNELCECVEKVKNSIDRLSASGIQPTEFEAITATAFLFFKKMKCDFVVLEVGLGGRLDSTNVISESCVSVITSISLDHTAVLGDTIEKIASEKCGIIKKNGLVTTYPFQDDSAMNVIKKICRNNSALLTVPDASSIEIKSESFCGTTVKYKKLEFILPLAGKHMVYNACTAIEAIKSLRNIGYTISDNSIKEGISVSTMPARLELIKKNPIVLLDGGHNEGCAEALANFIDEYFFNKRIIMVSSIMADKDYLSYLKTVATRAKIFIATKADVPRALDSEELMKSAGIFCKNVYSVSNPSKAIDFALEKINQNDVLIVCGSFYLAGEVRNKLLKI